MQDNFDSILLFVVCIFEAYCLQYLFSGFIEPKVKNKIVGKVGISLAWILLWFSDSLLFNFSDGSFLVQSNISLLLRTLILFIFSVFWYKDSILRKAFLVIQFLAIRELTLFCTYSLLYGYDILLKCLIGMWSSEMIEVENYQFASNLIMSIVIIVIEIIRCLLLYFSVKKIVRSFSYKENMEKEVLYYSLPAIAGILVSILLRQLITTTMSETGVNIYEKYPLLYVIAPMITFILLVADIICFKMYQDMIGLQKERAEKIIIQNQIMQMQNAMLEMDCLYDGVRRIRHDMKNQMTVLQSLLQEKGILADSKNEELRIYIEDMFGAIDQTETKIRTGNTVCDAIINNKFHVAENEIENIRVNADYFTMKEEIGIKAYDIGIILNNGLDNAIEACKRLRKKNRDIDTFITIRSFRNGKMHFIEIANSFDGTIHFDKASGYPVSTKENKELHGIGLKNVKKCAIKYGGDIDFIVKDNIFILSVMIKG